MRSERKIIPDTIVGGGQELICGQKVGVCNTEEDEKKFDEKEKRELTNVICTETGKRKRKEEKDNCRQREEREECTEGRRTCSQRKRVSESGKSNQKFKKEYDEEEKGDENVRKERRYKITEDKREGGGVGC